jgi:hypothetical protein
MSFFVSERSAGEAADAVLWPSLLSLKQLVVMMAGSRLSPPCLAPCRVTHYFLEGSVLAFSPLAEGSVDGVGALVVLVVANDLALFVRASTATVMF